jgi:hypothetical protein
MDIGDRMSATIGKAKKDTPTTTIKLKKGNVNYGE